MTQDRTLGPLVPDWTPPPAPDHTPMHGRYAALVPLKADAHAALLYREFSGHDHLFDYLPDGPFASASQFHRWAREAEQSRDMLFYAVQDRGSQRFVGVLSYLRIAPAAGSIEVGNINFSPALQRTRAATEAIYLTMAWAFEAGYRRFEWKCNALNMPSRRAAQRLGLSYEGIFRQAVVIKGRNRDTAWFAAIDAEWPALQEAYRLWLDPANFDGKGQQIERLSDLTRLVRVSSDPAL
ncbi:MAG: GNAT family protein [Pseudomonadota bacterium]